MVKEKLKNRIALITGASRGIGAAVAKRFAAEGTHVILVARTVGGLEEVDDAIKKSGGSATLVPLDLREEEKIDQLAGLVNERFGRLDILVGNAGTLGVLSPLPHVPPKKWEDTISLNLTSNFRLIRAFDPLLKKSDSGRVIFVTSGVAQGTFPYWGPYAVSKAGLEALAKTYAGECENTNIRVNIIDPGEVRTNMRAQAMPGENPESLPLPEEITDRFVELAAAAYNKNGRRVAA